MSQIHWLNAFSGSFTNPSDWSGGEVPGASDDAILDAVGSAFTVTSGSNETVESVQLAANATLSLTGKTFTATAGTGAGANAGVILVGAGATLITGEMVTNTGMIALYGGAGGAAGGALLFNGFTTLSGGGEILLEGQGATMSSRGRGALYNVDNTITGSGTIANRLELFNEQGGVIDANGSTPLFIGEVGNAGLIEATGGGELTLKGGAGNRSTGVILAGRGSVVQVKPSTKLEGGTLESVGSGKFVIKDAYIGGAYAGDNLIIDAHLEIVGPVVIKDTIVNNTTITLSKGGFAVLVAATLEGNGDINLDGGGIDGFHASLSLAGGTISGSGAVGGSVSNPLYLTIGAAGVIDGNGASALTVHTYASIVSAGTVESSGAGGLVIDDAIINNGTLSVLGGGTLEADGAVSGKGEAIVGGGTLDFLSSFNQAVTFTGGGTLTLAQSQGFTNSVKGFSNTGATTLDLKDIGFVDAGEATFSGTSSGGVLTVTDGTHTASITLKGNYLNATFTASSDGGGGTDVVGGKAMGDAAPVHAFVAAMAALGAPSASGSWFGEAWITRTPFLSRPHMTPP